LTLPEMQGLRSYGKHIRTVRDHLMPFFANRLLGDIRANDVEAYRAGRMRHDGTPASLSTVNWDHAVLKAMLNKAVQRDLITVTPASKVTLPNPK
jgi:hypothetical protein